MKIDRLIGILSVLLQKEQVTAPYLAEMFEVSKRTINRDIETLCQAGIPIITKQGVNGGISIMENFKVDKTLLTTTDMQDIIAGLRSLDSINGTNRYSQLIERFLVGGSDFMVGNQSILIDLSSWDKNGLVSKIEMIRNAIYSCKQIKFNYYSPKGETIRTIEPYYLIFHWSSWYVWGWCELKRDFRLFKLNRMDKLQLADEYIKKNAPMPDLRTEKVFPEEIKVKALFDSSCKWRIVEEFGIDSFEEQEDGKLLFQSGYSDKENLLIWLMTFGDKATLLEPKELIPELYNMLKNMLKNYEEYDL